MSSRDETWKRFVESRDIDVPEDAVENELNFMMLDMRHRMQYDTLTGGGYHFNARAELAEQEEELRALARFEVKSGLVMKALLAERQFTVTQEELEAEAEAMARRQNTTVELIRTFFGGDLAMLERDVKERKAIDWVCEQANNETK